METNITQKINIYSDGVANPNPGKGGFGVILTYPKPEGCHRKEFFQGYKLTTNNRINGCYIWA